VFCKYALDTAGQRSGDAPKFQKAQAFREDRSPRMSLQDVYARAWIKKRGLGPGWIVNLEPTYNLSLGAVGVVDGWHFKEETSLDRRGVTGLQLDPNQRRDHTPWQFQSNEQITIGLSSSGTTSGAAGAVGNANWDVDVKFGSTSGASIHGTAMWWNGYADLGLVRSGIIEAARDGRLHKGESVVVTQQLTGSGVLFLAEGHDASLKVTATIDVAPGTTPPISSLSGKLSMVRTSGGAQSQSFADGTVLAARLLYLGTRGWMWWRRFEVYGARPPDADEVEETLMQPREGDATDEYFALV
jgi:hypothetical protein